LARRPSGASRPSRVAPTSASSNLHRGAGGEFWWTYDQLVHLGSDPLRFEGFAKAAAENGSRLVAELEGVRLVRVADGRSMLLTFMLGESGPNGIQAILASEPDGRMELVSGSAEGIQRRLPGRLRDARFEPVELTEGVLAEFFGGP
jgi:hypothetical protein